MNFIVHYPSSLVLLLLGSEVLTLSAVLASILPLLLLPASSATNWNHRSFDQHGVSSGSTRKLTHLSPRNWSRNWMEWNWVEDRLSWALQPWGDYQLINFWWWFFWKEHPEWPDQKDYLLLFQSAPPPRLIHPSCQCWCSNSWTHRRDLITSPWNLSFSDNFLYSSCSRMHFLQLSPAT